MKVVFRCPPELKRLLPKPLPAKRGLPAWLRDMPMTVPSLDAGGDIRTLKQCPPFLDAMSAGFLIPLATDIEVDHGIFRWDWDLPPSRAGRYTRSPIAFHLSDQAEGAPFHQPDRMVVKFNNFWTIALKAGYSLLVTHPFNREDLPFRTLTGLVDADLYQDGFIQFPALWLDPDFVGRLAKGTPIAQCLPVPREALDLKFDELTAAAAERFAETKEAVSSEPGVYKRRYRAKKPR